MVDPFVEQIADAQVAHRWMFGAALQLRSAQCRYQRKALGAPCRQLGEQSRRGSFIIAPVTCHLVWIPWFAGITRLCQDAADPATKAPLFRFDEMADYFVD